MDLGVLGRDRHHLAAAPGDRAHIAVGLAVRLHGGALRRVELLDRIGDLEIEKLGRALEALRMLGAFEDFAPIGALALEDAGAVMQAMRQYVELGIAPRHELAVEPDEAVTIVERQERHVVLLDVIASPFGAITDCGA
jgi:hypothetical protein